MLQDDEIRRKTQRTLKYLLNKEQEKIEEFVKSNVLEILVGLENVIKTQRCFMEALKLQK